jgi:hypothetical protein
VHRRGAVYYELTPQISFFFIAFGVHTLGSAKNTPIHIFKWVARVVLAVFGKLNREAVKGAFMQPNQEALNHLFGK